MARSLMHILLLRIFCFQCISACIFRLFLVHERSQSSDEILGLLLMHLHPIELVFSKFQVVVYFEAESFTQRELSKNKVIRIQKNRVNAMKRQYE